MLTIRSSAAMERILALPLPASLHRLLHDRLSQLSEHAGYDLGALAHFVIVQEGDAIDDVEAELGFSPFINQVDGARFGDPDFQPSWEWIEDHGDWFECPFILSDDGFGHVLIVEKAAGVNPDLLSLCRAYTA